jgi:hypothetical protein
MNRHFGRWAAAALLVAGWPALAAADAGPANEPWLRVTVEQEAVILDVGREHDQSSLVVVAPNGRSFVRPFQRGERAVLTLQDLEAGLEGDVEDGCYRLELRLTPLLSAEDRSRLKRNRDKGLPPPADLRDRLVDNAAATIVTLEEGVFVKPVEEPDGRRREGAAAAPPAGAQELAGVGERAPVPGGLEFDQVIPDDLIVQGSECVGFDCVNGESFGFDTIRLKENNLRIHFDDTSSIAGFPNRDWRIIINDSASGGAGKFSIEDSTGARLPFTIEAGTPANAIYADSSGRIGFRTATPALELHVSDGDTPGLRLEQNGGSGFAPQSWDVAGNETNFFIRDVTNGSRLSFRIRPGAPTSSIDIDPDGNVGIGTASADHPIHVIRSNATARIQVDETNATAARRTLMQLQNNGTTEMSLLDTSTSVNWSLRTQGNDFFISRLASGVEEMRIQNGGNVTIAGTLTQGSDRNTKRDIVPVNAQEVLARLAGLSISTWNRKTDDPSVRHLGPMAQDFAAAFDLGEDDTSIAVLDMAGVSLAAIQALQQELTEKDEQIQALEERLAALERLVTAPPAQP